MHEQMVLPIIVLIDNDDSFIYLVGRYAEQCGFGFGHAPTIQAAHGLIGQLRPALVVFNQLLAASAEPGVLEALQAELADRDIPSAGFAQANNEPVRDQLGVDYELCLPLLYDDFCSALAALGIARPPGERGAALH